MNWLIFGDDWNGHPSTTQHLALHLPAEDRVIWVNSIGMRSPALHLSDLRRLVNKARSAMRGAESRPVSQMASDCPRSIEVIPPLVLPWHQQPMARWFNARSLRRSILAAIRRQAFERFTILVSNPIAIFYLSGLPCECLCYLRLDDYPNLPGVDARLAIQAEAQIMKVSQALFVTASNLMPPLAYENQAQVYLSQGVDLQHFAGIPLTPPRSRVLGFYGMLAEWLDYRLIERVADASPDWTLELIGPIRNAPESLRAKSNIRFLPPVSYADLPRAIQHWDAAWIPFRINSLTRAVNPLKLREYLAAGLPTLSTPLPEAQALSATVALSYTPEGVREWLESTVAADTAQRRLERRDAVRDDGWDGRARILRDRVAQICGASRAKEHSKLVPFSEAQPVLQVS